MTSSINLGVWEFTKRQPTPLSLQVAQVVQLRVSASKLSKNRLFRGNTFEPWIFEVGNPHGCWHSAFTGRITTETFTWPERPGASNNFRRSFRRSKASKLISVTFMSKLLSDLRWDKKKYQKNHIKHIKQRVVLYFLQMPIPFLHQMSQSRQEISPQKCIQKKPEGIHRAPSRILSAKSPFWNLLPRFSCCHQTPGEWHRATDNVCVYISFTNWVMGGYSTNKTATFCNVS